MPFQDIQMKIATSLDSSGLAAAREEASRRNI